MAGAMYAETSEPLEHSVQLIPESRSQRLSSLREKLRNKHCLILLLVCEVRTKVLTLQSDSDLLITPVTLSGSEQQLLSASSAPQPHGSWLQLKGKLDISATFLSSSQGLLITGSWGQGSLNRVSTLST